MTTDNNLPALQFALQFEGFFYTVNHQGLVEEKYLKQMHNKLLEIFNAYQAHYALNKKLVEALNAGQITYENHTAEAAKQWAIVARNTQKQALELAKQHGVV